ncbi:queuosine precursor transporter [uncultured Methanobrevibacter sp.]|uniref:queuosine precursor transporter n=1 Tax=uncultured Methanobrevibacter sp. TaxID=253161 RepID=UPI0025D0EEDE|nr:queuosine precursor transporter [uncultured Methanobrevibacter sp.]
MFENITKTRVYAYLAGIFCASVIVSNILATKTLEFEFIALPCSILTFPVLFIVNDILSEIYGYDMTKDVVYLGFIINIIAIVLYHVAMAFTSSSQNASSFVTILSTTPRLFVAGLISYTLGNLLNSIVLVKLKEKYNDKLFVRCILSTVIGETADSIIFITISFVGVFPNNLILTMICCQIVFKVLYELLAYPITRKVIFYIRTLDDGELKSQI